MATVAQLKVEVWDDDSMFDDFVDFLHQELIVTEGDVVTKDPWTLETVGRTL